MFFFFQGWVGLIFVLKYLFRLIRTFLFLFIVLFVSFCCGVSASPDNPDPTPILARLYYTHDEHVPHYPRGRLLLKGNYKLTMKAGSDFAGLLVRWVL